MLSLRLSTLPLLALAALAPAQIRVATWNVSNYGGGRIADIQTAVYGAFANGTANKTSFRPDALMVQEVQSAAAQTAFLTALNTAPGGFTDWAAAPFTNGADTDNAFFYRTSKIAFTQGVTISTGGNSPLPPRDTDRYDVTLKGYSGGQAPQLSLYSAHLKAQDSGQDDDNRRLAETTAIRNDAQTLGHAFIVGGDFNVQSSNDIGYAELIGSQTNDGGRFFDPMKRSTNVTWENRAEYSYLHTQDPTGSGGMDSRFDFLLTNGGLVDGKGFDYVGDATKAYTPDAGSTWNDSAHSYTVWGNDGTSFNATLKTTGNTEVGGTIAQALKNAATTAGGHLPVFLDLRAPGQIVTSTSLLDFGTVTVGQTAVAGLDVFDSVDTSILGDDVASILYSLSTTSGFSAPTGTFSDALGGGANGHLFTFDGASTAGVYSGLLTILSSDPDVLGRTVAFRVNVQAVPEPSAFAALGLGALAMLRRRRKA